MTSSTTRMLPLAANVMLSIAYQLLVVLVQQTSGYPTAPPVAAFPELCSTMYPQHGVSAQTTVAPYSITVKGPNGAACYKPATPIDVTLAAVGNGTTFNGFLMEARQSPTVNASYGIFNSAGNAIVTPYNCFGQTNNVIGHNQNVNSMTTKFTWTAPSTLSGDVTFLATVTKNGPTFWVQGVRLNVAMCSGSSIVTAGLSSATVVMATLLFLWQL